MMTSKVTLNGDGAGTARETLSSGLTAGPAPLTYQGAGDGRFDFSTTGQGGVARVGPHFFSRDASAYGYLYNDPSNSGLSLGIGFGVQSDRSVTKVTGLYHAFILAHTANTSFAVLQHDYVFSEDGTGTITVDGQTVQFAYAVVDGVITIQFPGSAHNPLSALISRDGQYMVAYDMTNISQNVGIRIFVKGGDAASASDIEGTYHVIALRNTTGGQRCVLGTVRHGNFRRPKHSNINRWPHKRKIHFDVQCCKRRRDQYSIPRGRPQQGVDKPGSRGHHQCSYSEFSGRRSGSIVFDFNEEVVRSSILRTIRK